MTKTDETLLMRFMKEWDLSFATGVSIFIFRNYELRKAETCRAVDSQWFCLRWIVADVSPYL